MDAWNGINMGFIDPEHLCRPTQEYQDIPICASWGRQACTSSVTPIYDGAMQFNYDVTVKKLSKFTTAPY